MPTGKHRPSPRRRRRPQHTRQALVAAAADLFAERGFDGVRVQEVAKRAGVTTGALYRHFSGKAELLAEAVDTIPTTGIDRLIAEHEAGADLATALVNVATSTITAPLTNREALVLEALVAARRDPRVARAMRQRLRQRQKTLARLLATDPTIRHDLAPDAIAWLAYLVSLGLLLSRASRPPVPTKSDWTKVLDAVADGLTRPPEPRGAHRPQKGGNHADRAT